MLSYGSAFYQLKEQLQPLYDGNEAAAIAHNLLEFITGLNKIDRLGKKDVLFTARQAEAYISKSTELIAGKPVQYVIHSAWFMGRAFYVDGSVLIPRPETEELVQWIIADNKSRNGSKILDIGTGSGCIPISLQLAMHDAEITACDISDEALAVAEKNAVSMGVAIQFLQMNFLDNMAHNNLGIYDVIVSNPPYIPEAEQVNMHKNVVQYEPSIALFVPDNDALVFYRAIAGFGKGHLAKEGYIYCELEAAHAQDCKMLFENMGYSKVEIRKDMHGNWRMLRAMI